MYRDRWPLEQERRANLKREKEEADAAAQNEKAAKLEDEARKSRIFGIGSFWTQGLRRSGRHRQPEDQRASGLGSGGELTMSGANTGVIMWCPGEPRRLVAWIRYFIRTY